MDLKRELETRATTFNTQLSSFLKQGSPQQLYDAAMHLPLGGGKRLRPFLAMVACESVSGEVQKVMPFAIALELVHNFTLVHDDIMDNSHLRRNLPTVHIKYGEPTAILAGDFLFAKSLEAMHETPVDATVLKELSAGLIKCIEDICKGQQLDMEFEQRKTVSEQEYLDMVHKKTAVLFRFAARGGGIIGEGSTEEINALTEFGTHLGLGFQIWDDYLDLSSDESILGKDIGNDIRNGKKTLIAVNALANATGEDSKLLEDLFGNKNASESDIKRILQLFRDVQAVDYAKHTAVMYSTKAKDALDTLTDSEAQNILKALVDFSIQREK